MWKSLKAPTAAAAAAAAAGGSRKMSSRRYAKIFRGWIQDTFTPCAALLVSDGAEAACARNNLTFEQLLQPFSSIRQQLRIRMVAQTAVLQSLTMRFVPATDFAPRSVEENEGTLANVAGATKMPTVPQGADFDRVHDVEYETEWLAAAKSEIFDGQRFGQSEMLDQPVCFLYVVCSSESNPLRRLEQMIQNGDMAPSFTRQYNCSIPRFYVLLHDAASTEAGSSEAEVEALFQKMRRLYAVGDSQQTRTFLVRINSRPEDAAAAAAAEGKSPDEIAAELRRHRHKVTDLWNFLGNNAPSDAGGARASHDGLDGDGLEIGSAQSAVGERGALLSEEDVRGLRNFPVEFTQNGLFPALEQFVAELNAGIDKEKKGIKNAWRSWWKKPKAEAVQVGQLQYAHSDIVSRVRTLADLSFIFRDYETAHTMYRMVKEDTKLDKAWNHYAGAVEMVALSLFM